MEREETDDDNIQTIDTSSSDSINQSDDLPPGLCSYELMYLRDYFFLQKILMNR